MGSVLSERMKLKSGDKLSLETLEGTKELRIAGIVNDYIAGGLTIYMHRKQAETLFHVEGHDAFIVRAEPGKIDEVEDKVRRLSDSFGLIFQSNAELVAMIQGLSKGGEWWFVGSSPTELRDRSFWSHQYHLDEHPGANSRDRTPASGRHDEDADSQDGPCPSFIARAHRICAGCDDGDLAGLLDQPFDPCRDRTHHRVRVPTGTRDAQPVGLFWASAFSFADPCRASSSLAALSCSSLRIKSRM